MNFLFPIREGTVVYGDWWGLITPLSELKEGYLVVPSECLGERLGPVLYACPKLTHICLGGAHVMSFLHLLDSKKYVLVNKPFRMGYEMQMWFASKLIEIAPRLKCSFSCAVSTEDPYDFYFTMFTSKHIKCKVKGNVVFLTNQAHFDTYPLLLNTEHTIVLSDTEFIREIPEYSRHQNLTIVNPFAMMDQRLPPCRRYVCEWLGGSVFDPFPLEIFQAKYDYFKLIVKGNAMVRHLDVSDLNPGTLQFEIEGAGEEFSSRARTRNIVYMQILPLLSVFKRELGHRSALRRLNTDMLREITKMLI